MTSPRSNNASSSRSSALQAARTTEDARLESEFQKSAGGAGSMKAPSFSPGISAYAQRIQRGNQIQPFGCVIAVQNETFSVIAFSENASEMLDLAPHAVPSIEQQEALSIGTNARDLFTPQSAVALQKAAAFADVNILNPILVHCKNSGKPFYAILHRNDARLVIDLEPVNPSDVPVTAAGALKSYKLAAKSISRLQSLPSGNISLLCDVLVKEVKDLTGYDRVMAYKFHEDEHGEVVSECRRPDLEAYLGLHYPATDIPQASRFLFMKNKIRMICDCSAKPVRIIQDKRLSQPLSLCGSTLRAPHGCHAQYMANMGSVASLVMSVIINDEDVDHGGEEQTKARKLWGLVVCHHTNPRFIPFPLRYACEFLMQVFSIQVNKEVELAAQKREKHILKTQTVLCDMLLREAPVGIFTQSPNVMDLVKCDGAALFYRNQFSLLGVTPTEAQIKDICKWMMDWHTNSTGFSTDSLSEAGYPGASYLGDDVCGMAVIRITSKDFIFWFRSHVASEIKWGGAKRELVGEGEEGRKLYPRSSFDAFLEVVKRRSLPWDDVEMDAIHSLQLILRSAIKDEVEGENPKPPASLISQDAKRVQGVDEMRTAVKEMVRLVETASVPVLAVDSSWNVNGWNVKVAELTGLPMEKAIGTPLVDLVEDDSVQVVRKMLSLAFLGGFKIIQN